MNASIPADERLWTLCQTADADGAPVRILPTDLATLIDSVLSVITSDTEENRARVRAVKPDIDAQLERAIASQDLWHAIHVAWWYAESRDGSRAAEMARQVAFFRTAAEGLK